MSVINQMLRDLDARGQGDAARAAALAAAGHAPQAYDRGAATTRLRWALAVVTLMLAGVVAVMLWTRMSQVAAIEAAAAPAAVALDTPVPAPAASVPAPPPAVAPAPAAVSTAQPAAPRAPVPAPEPASIATPPIPAAPPPSVAEPPPPSRTSIERVEIPPSFDALEGARSALAGGDAEGALSVLGATRVASAEGDALKAAALQQLGRNAEAIAAYTRALRREPDIGAWWAGLGISLESEGRAAEALDAFREAQRRGPLDPALADYLGERVEALSAGEPPR